MITLNTEKGFVHIDEWEDVISRPGFDDNLDPRKSTLDAVIGQYIHKESIRCGLSSCHTAHKKGYLVSTKDGRETNIGKDCGKTHFGVDFDSLSKRFDRLYREHEYRNTLWSFSFQLEELEEETKSLRMGEQGANEIYSRSRKLIQHNRGCPDGVVNRVRQMVRARNSALIEQREATDSEIEDLEEIEGLKLSKPHYIETQFGELSGLDSLYQENDLRELLVIELETNIKEFSELDIDQLSHSELKYWSNWTATVPVVLERAASSIRNGRLLLSASNLKKLERFSAAGEERKQFREFLARTAIS